MLILNIIPGHDCCMLCLAKIRLQSETKKQNIESREIHFMSQLNQKKMKRAIGPPVEQSIYADVIIHK